MSFLKRQRWGSSCCWANGWQCHEKWPELLLLQSHVEKYHMPRSMCDDKKAFLTSAAVLSITSVPPLTCTPSSFHHHRDVLFSCFVLCVITNLAGQQCTQRLNACSSAAAHHGLWCSSLSSNHSTESLPSISCSACPLCGRTKGCKPNYFPLSCSLSLPDMEKQKLFLSSM